MVVNHIGRPGYRARSSSLKLNVFVRQNKLKSQEKGGNNDVDALEVFTQQTGRVENNLGQHLAKTDL